MNEKLEINSNKNITRYETRVNRKEREALLNQRSFILWFTGLSASGKSTIGNNLEYILYKLGYVTFLLDGDNLRDGLNNDLGFSEIDRKENIRRVAYISRLMLDAGIIVITTFISPFKEDREFVRDLVGTGNFIEVFVDCPLKLCIERDRKGLYNKALNKEINDFTGISSPYEIPEKPEIVIDACKMNSDEAAEYILNYLQKNNFIEIKR
jgi:adenylylsulfate kinase